MLSRLYKFLLDGAHLERQSGFTLIEFLLVLALILVLTGLGLFYGVSNYQQSQFRSEQELVVGVLQQARAKSMANINQQPHGVRVEADKYVLFEGSTYNAASPMNRDYPASGTISRSGMTEVLFDQVSGKATVTGGSLTLSQNLSSSIISITSVGQISWTN